MIIPITKLEPIVVTIYIDSELTKEQKKYISIIENYKYNNKKIPTIREIAKLINVKSPATVDAMLRRLKCKGYDYKLL